jgi:hypothetical protein
MRAAASKAEEEMTRGTSGTVEMRWPRARRRAGTEEAARAEVVAKRLNWDQWLMVSRLELGLIFSLLA